jgi:hypothetical protein
MGSKQKGCRSSSNLMLERAVEADPALFLSCAKVHTRHVCCKIATRVLDTRQKIIPRAHLNAKNQLVTSVPLNEWSASCPLSELN